MSDAAAQTPIESPAAAAPAAPKVAQTRKPSPARKPAAAAPAAPKVAQTPIDDGGDEPTPEQLAAAEAQVKPLNEEEKDPTSPQFEHRKKLVREAAQRKASNIVVDEWLEVTPNKLSKKGGKVVRCKRTKNGNVYRSLAGFEKQCAVDIARAKKAGKLRTA